MRQLRRAGSGGGGGFRMWNGRCGKNIVAIFDASDGSDTFGRFGPFSGRFRMLSELTSPPFSELIELIDQLRELFVKL